MYFDALSMACVVGELRSLLLGGRIQTALLPDRLSVGLEVYAGHRRYYLIASAHPELCRVHLSSGKLRRGVEVQTGLLLLLRKYARGAILAEVHQPPFERILRLGLDHPEWGRTDLVVEVMGRHSNILLIGPGERILDVAKRVTGQMSPVRPILPGLPYRAPPAQEKLPPDQLTEVRLQQLLAAAEPGTQVWQVLVNGLRGVSPLLAREVTFRALGQARAPLDRVSRLLPLIDALGDLLAPLKGAQWQPTLILEQGLPAIYAPYPLTHRGEPVSTPSLSLAVEQVTAALTSADPYGPAKRPVQEAISAAQARLERRGEALDRALTAAGGGQRYREWGEWILALAHTVTPRQAELIAETGAEEPLRIPLDPDLTAVENAQACFARYRKAQRAAEGVPERLAEVRLALQDLDQLACDLQLASSRPEIDAVRAALIEAGHVRTRPGRTARRRARGGSLGAGPISVLSPDGLPIWVGRNSRQNDELTFRRAGGDDWWFHARGVPGAHVVVRAEGSELPAATLGRAAELAAHYSRLRGEPRVQVDYTRRRHVRRIPGAAPGLVTYGHEQSVWAVPRGIEEPGTKPRLRTGD